MTHLTTFNYLSNKVRVIEIDDHPLFVAADACRAIEMDTTNGTYQWLKSIDADEKMVIHREDYPESFSGFRGMSLTLLTEPGLYKLISRSNKPEAKAFDRWVRHEVLPAIRKDGAYIQGEELVKTGELDEEEFVLRAMEILQRKVKRLTEERDEAKARANDLEGPAAAGCDRRLHPSHNALPAQPF